MKLYKVQIIGGAFNAVVREIKVKAFDENHARMQVEAALDSHEYKTYKCGEIMEYADKLVEGVDYVTSCPVKQCKL